jgi:hypothetical protein
MTELDVALTDYFLALEAFLFVVLLVRQRNNTGWLRSWFAVYFLAASVASACGGTVHGFLNEEQTGVYAILWRATLLAVGVAALANWAIGAKLLCSHHAAQWIILAAGVQLAAYVVTIVFVSQDFSVAIADNLPAVVFLIVALLLTYRRQPRAGLLVAAGGMSLTLVASALQQLEIGIHRQHFNHNAVFHVVQAVALFMLFRGCRSLIGLDTEPSSTGHSEPQLASVSAADVGARREVSSPHVHSS